MAVARKCDRCGTYHDGPIFKLTTEPGCPSAEFDDFMIGVKPKDLLTRLQGLFK